MSTWSYISSLARRHKNVGWSVVLIITWVLVALIDPLSEHLIGYHYTNLNAAERLLPPLSSGAQGIHWLGTDQLGRDLLSGMIHGARVAAIVSFLTVGIAVVVGLFVGVLIGYYGDQGVKKNIAQQIILLLAAVLTIYYLISLSRAGITMWSISQIMIVLGTALLLDRIAGKLTWKKYGLPLDMLIQRLFELRESIPGLFIILALVAVIAKPSIVSVSVIIAILYWMTFARHARVEALAIREEDYVKSAKASGVPDLKLIYRHILPNAMPAIYVIIAFTFSSVILLESSLSFLGIGIPLEEVSWGKILASSRKSTKAWWLAVFPGMAIFIVLFAFNRLAEYLGVRERG